MSFHVFGDRVALTHHRSVPMHTRAAERIARGDTYRRPTNSGNTEVPVKVCTRIRRSPFSTRRSRSDKHRYPSQSALAVAIGVSKTSVRNSIIRHSKFPGKQPSDENAQYLCSMKRYFIELDDEDARSEECEEGVAGGEKKRRKM